jgi:hypothetical protein
MLLSTEIGNKTVTLQCRDELEPYAAGFLNDLRKTFAPQSERLKHGFRIQWGWGPLCLMDRTPDLLLCEPNFRGNPFLEWSNDVSTTLTVLLQQVDFLRSIDFPLPTPSRRGLTTRSFCQKAVCPISASISSASRLPKKATRAGP